MGNKLLFIIFAALLAGLVALLIKMFPGVINNQQGYTSLGFSLVMILLFVTSLFRNNPNWRLILLNCVTWLAISFVLVTGYSYQYELKSFGYRLLGNVVPSLVQSNGNGSVTIYGGQQGHFMANAQVNGAKVHFLIDTGASDVVLTPKDAEQAGIDMASLVYSSVVQTANGSTATAPVILSSVQVGEVVVKNVRANVSQGNLDISLLGMSFLTKLKGYVVNQGTLTLYQ